MVFCKNDQEEFQRYHVWDSRLAVSCWTIIIETYQKSMGQGSRKYPWGLLKNWYAADFVNMTFRIPKQILT